MMVDDSTYYERLIMNKNTFVVEIVGDVDGRSIVAALADSVDGVGEFRCVEQTDTVALSDQGLKVWAKRKVGISLATPKAPKAPKAKVAETADA